MIKQEDVRKALEAVQYKGKSIVNSGVLQKVEAKDDIFGKEIKVDLQIDTPAMHVKKQLEEDVSRVLKEKFGDDVDVKTTIRVVVPENEKMKPIEKIKNIIAVASGKGGVGKSTVTANLAATLAKMGFKVGILDADVYGPSIPLMFGTQDERPLAVKEDGKVKILPVESHGVKLLSIGYFADPGQAVIWRGSMANSALNQMMFDTKWGDLDFLLIDLPPGTGDIQLSVMQMVPVTGAVVVTTPQNVAVADVRKAINMFQNPSINVPVLGIIENMSYFQPAECPENKYYIFGRDGGKLLADNLGLPLLGEVPLVQSVREAGDAGRPSALQENTEVAKIWEDITKNVVEKTVERNKKLPPTEKIRITNQAGCAVK
ncbi:MAG: P-loop NTPase [Chlorobi bacterium]|nr:P-loop NTPase [Chlorobiota bacterium]